MDYSFHYELQFNMINFLLSVLIIYMLISYIKSRTRAQVMAERLEDEGPTPQIMLIGNENYSISGLVYEGKRIPDIEIKSRVLYVDGVYKRKLARNSRVYNRGVGIFVDGKYVG